MRALGFGGGGDDAAEGAEGAEGAPRTRTVVGFFLLRAKAHPVVAGGDVIVNARSKAVLALRCLELSLSRRSAAWTALGANPGSGGWGRLRERIVDFAVGGAQYRRQQ